MRSKNSPKAARPMKPHADMLTASEKLIVPAATSEVLRISVDDVARFGREIDNVRAALDWSFAPAGDPVIGVSLTAAFAPVWVRLSLLGECCERAERALAFLASGVVLSVPLNRRLHIAFGIAL